MAGFEIPNLAYIRNIPVFGARLYEALHGAQQAIVTMATQGNLNPNGDVEPPPAIQGVTATGKNGVLTVSIEHTAAYVQRGVVYHVEHADNAGFVNPQIRNIGDSRSFSEFIGAQSRFVRASASYPGSSAGPLVYHGGGATPVAVKGGGLIGGVPYMPSQGSGTGAPGQGGVGPGPVLIRSQDNGFDWKLQRPIGSEISQAVSPGSQNGIGSPVNNGSSGGAVSVSESVIAMCEYLSSVAGTGNAITGITSTPYSSLANGFLLRYVPIHDNSAATSLNVNSIGAKAVTKNGVVALVGGELVTGRCYLLIYDGTQFQLIGQISPISATVLASDAHGISSVAALTDASVWIGDPSDLPVEHALSGDATMTDAGVVTVSKLNNASIPASASIAGTNGSRQIITATSLVIQAAVGFVYVATETGANNAIACAAGSGPPLVDGLMVTVKLAHTLQGASLGNTFAYLGGTARAIVSHFNPANNTVTAYVSGGYVHMAYSLSLTAWLDLSQ